VYRQTSWETAYDGQPSEHNGQILDFNQSIILIYLQKLSTNTHKVFLKTYFAFGFDRVYDATRNSIFYKSQWSKWLTIILSMTYSNSSLQEKENNGYIIKSTGTKIAVLKL
jgi:hypothetical protein